MAETDSRSTRQLFNEWRKGDGQAGQAMAQRFADWYYAITTSRLGESRGRAPCDAACAKFGEGIVQVNDAKALVGWAHDIVLQELETTGSRATDGDEPNAYTGDKHPKELLAQARQHLPAEVGLLKAVYAGQSSKSGIDRLAAPLGGNPLGTLKARYRVKQWLRDNEGVPFEVAPDQPVLDRAPLPLYESGRMATPQEEIHFEQWMISDIDLCRDIAEFAHFAIALRGGLPEDGRGGVDLDELEDAAGLSREALRSLARLRPRPMDDHVSTPAWHLHPETRTALRLDRVRKALDDGAWADAVLEAEELLDESPDDDEAQFRLGEALLELGDHELAHAVFSERVRLVPSDRASLLGLAVAAFHLCDFPLATESAREVVRRAPDEAEAHFVLGLVLERDPARRAEAMASLTAAARLDPDRFPLPLALGPERWQEAVELALEKIDPRIRTFWERVPVRIEPCPDLTDLRVVDPPISPSVAALYAGRPPEDSDPYDHPPEAIRLFSNNLGRSPTFDAMVDDLAEAFENEALDWLGLEREALDAT